MSVLFCVCARDLGVLGVLTLFYFLFFSVIGLSGRCFILLLSVTVLLVCTLLLAITLIRFTGKCLFIRVNNPS